ncbi:Inner nuclear membrane protein Man1 [Armadillidium nasatum]|uniref:Inner nuclear membrane protein Man1 n=1 Tax=Armadillidium nasatum TaxID=96803 RepID=A0A5N5TPW1_9CRUS|nr:Inner nuclear membrane protein Man1 [Armadillidium nasatum]
MMASLGHLSDDELRSKLKEYGINSPVTANTRTVLLKKLNHIISSKVNEPINSQSRSSYKDSTNNSNADGPVPKGVRSSRHTRKDVFLIDESPVRVSPRSRVSINKKNSGPTTSKSTILGSRRTNLSGFSSDEDDTDAIFENTHKRGIRKFNIEDGHDSSRTQNLSEGLSFGKKLPVVRKRTEYSPSFKEVKQSSRSINYEDSLDSESEPEISNERNSLRLKSNSVKYFNAGKNFFNNDVFPRHEDNYISHSRLPLNSKLKNDQNSYEFQNNESFYGGKDPGEITSPDDIVFQEPINNTNSISNNISNYYGQNPLGKVKSLFLEHCSIDKEFWLPSVPILLVILLALFFCFLGICYVSIHTPLGPSKFFSFLNIFQVFQHKERVSAINGPTSAEEEFITGKKRDVFPVCEHETKADCLSTLEMEKVPQILGLLGNVIVPALSHHSGLYQCGKASLQYLTVKEMLELVRKELPSSRDPVIMLGLQGLGKLVTFNPHWGLIAVREVADDSARSLDAAELKGFGLSSNPIEIWCLLKFSLHNLLCFIFVVLVGVFALWIAYKTYIYFLKQAEEVEQKSYELVEQILEVLENSCGTSGKDFIAVYREVRSVGGEDCEVWRWVSGAPRSPVSCSKNAFELDSNHQPEKVWQGQAFESLETTQNVPHVSPTSCLKIRNMFDCEIEFGDHWPSRIQDSLLEKCEGITITHVAVDKASKEGCVYVKCGSPAEAGKAYRALHGWWFDASVIF